MTVNTESKLFPGLNDRQVEESRRLHGNNVLTPPKRESLWKLYLDKYKDPIIQILLFAALISLVLAFFEGNFMETVGIIAAVILATTIGFYFERDAVKKFSLLVQINEDQPVKVRRNGNVTTVPRRDIVVDDIIIVETGDEIPADAKLLTATNLQVNESSLTGEPLASKHVPGDGADARQADDAAPHKAGSTAAAYPEDLILRSTMVMNGHATARVVAVGDASEIGKVAQKASELTHTQTPLNRQLDRLAKFISKGGTVISVAAFVIFLVHDFISNPELWHSGDYFAMAHEVLKYFMMAVTLIVMAVPEGLPMAVTLSLALNMQRMLQSNILVRKLHASETMGAVTVICTDKTGTLTQNQMQVTDIRRFADAAESDDGERLLHAAIATNTTADLDGPEVVGNPTEGALLLWLRDTEKADYGSLRQRWTVIGQDPFSTEKKMMTTKAADGGHTYLFVKGAPEKILSLCRPGDDMRKDVETTLLEWQRKAMRTLALAYREDGASDDAPYTLQAIVAIADPVREGVPGNVAQCRKAGIHVKMVTGDTEATATEIARQIGMIEPAGGEGPHPRFSISGPDFEKLDDKEAAKAAHEIQVMYRARPTDKQRLVNLLQEQGEVVAVTGDGTNDAPALNHAQVGISLGSGTGVAKEASDITLLDDSFHSIVQAVMWGRSLYKNVQRFLFFQLVVNVTALLLVLAGSLVGTELPLTVTQILWINLIMDTFAALALASLPPSRECLAEKPRNQNDFIITRPMAFNILGYALAFFIVLFIYLLWCERHGTGSIIDIHELTCFFTTFVMLQFWNLFNAKCLGSDKSAFRYLWRDYGLLLVLVFILAGQWLIVTFGGAMFRTVPISLKEWAIIFVATSPVLWFGELVRAIKRIRKK